MRLATFGEIMLRLQPPGHLRFVQTDLYEAVFGGGEANVAVSLANYGLDVDFITKLPKHEIGQAAVNQIRRYGGNTDKIVRGGDRVGIYYCEKGASQRASKVIYDRAHAAIAEAEREDFDWDKLLDDVDWLHFTGITPALGPKVALIMKDCLEVCEAKGITVSCDLNYRKNLWTKEEAKKTMTELMPYVNVLIANEEDAADTFGIHASEVDVTSGDLDRAAYIDVAHQLKEKFGFDKVAITLRTSISASRNLWSGLLYDGEQECFAPQYDMTIVDRVGGGDSFCGGLIYALATGKDTQSAVNFAVAASCLKHTIEGDFNMMSVSEVEHLASGDASGRVQR